MKSVLILTSERTGTGHKSAANAIEKKLNSLDYETKQVDSFKLMGKVGNLLENSYIPITTRWPALYYIPFLLTQKFPNPMHFLIYLMSRKKLKEIINEYQPDLIISVHCMFTKAISRFLRKEKSKIPFYIDVIDLVKPPNVWLDNNADVIFVPTNEVKKDYIKKGIDKKKLLVSGFPIREDIQRRTVPKQIDDKVNILIVNPSVNLKKCVKYVEEVSKLDNVSINVICGRDKRLYKALTKKQKSGIIQDNVKIYSFVNNMNEFLENAHIILTKAGPNMILEAAKSGTAIVITGHIKGQENYNYKFVEDNNWGFRCEEPNTIYEKLNKFINSKKLNNCLKDILKADCNDGADFIANYIKENI